MGIVFTGVLVVLFGIFSLLAGLAIVGLGSIFVNLGLGGGGAIIQGLIAFVLGIAMFVSSYGLFARESWGWDLTIAVFVIDAARNLFGLVTGPDIIGLIILVLQVVIIAYIFSKQEYFEAPYTSILRETQ